MKIEELELLSSKISNINLLKSIVETFDNVPYEVRTRLFEELKNRDYNKYACSIAIDDNVLNSRTIEEQIKLMEELKKCYYNWHVYNIATNSNVLKNRTIEEQIRLIETLKSYDYNENAYKIAINSDVLKNRTIEEQLNLMRAFIKKGKVSHNDNLQKIQNIKEYKKYIKKLKKELGKGADVRLDTMVLEFIPDKKDRRKEN